MVSNLGLLNSDSKSLSFDGDPIYSVWFFRLEAALKVATARFVLMTNFTDPDNELLV